MKEGAEDKQKDDCKKQEVYGCKRFGDRFILHHDTNYFLKKLGLCKKF